MALAILKIKMVSRNNTVRQTAGKEALFYYRKVPNAGKQWPR